MIKHKYACDLNEMLDQALEIIAHARLRKIDVDEALDSLWELMINIDYELNANGCTTHGAKLNAMFTVSAN